MSKAKKSQVVEDRILGMEYVYWRELNDLQPDDLKVNANAEDIRASIQDNGFSQPFYAWRDPDTSKLYTIDGHTRKSVLLSMPGVPDQLPAVLIMANDRRQAIKILLEVFNQRHNKIDATAMTTWLKVEQVEVSTIAVESLHIAEAPTGDYYDVKNNDTPDRSAGPKSTDDEYSVFELVMLHENKLILLQVLNEVKTKHGIDKQEDALMYIINNHK